MTISSRGFVGVEDLPAITRFFDEARTLAGHDKGFLHAGDVWWRYGQYEPELHQLCLWFEADQLIGLGWVLSGNFLEIHLHPTLEDTVHDTLAREILDWATRICETDVQTSTTVDNTRLIAVFESLGFVQDNTEMLIYLFDLNNPFPDVELPNGFQARHVLEGNLRNESAFTVMHLTRPNLPCSGTLEFVQCQGIALNLIWWFRRLKASSRPTASSGFQMAWANLNPWELEGRSAGRVWVGR